MAAARRLNASWTRCQRWLALLWLWPAFACGAELDTVAGFEVERYLGRWYQIAHLPNRFQAVCARATVADYALREDGRIAVTNRCLNAAGGEERASGVARRQRGHDDPARLEVRFAPAWLSFLPFVWGDYWVMEVTADYSAALVGTPNREYLWILAREATLDRATYARFVDRARATGFPVTELRLEHIAAVSE